MALFRRSSPVKDLPEEVQQYYAAERRDRSWVSWLLALASLIVVLLLVMGIFFGGRWVVRKIRHTDAPKSTAGQQVTGQVNAPSVDGQTSPSGSTATTSNPSGTSSTSPNTTTPGTASPSTSTPSTTGPLATTATPSTGTAALTNTGPSNIIATFGVVTVTGTIGAYAFILRKQRFAVRR